MCRLLMGLDGPDLLDVCFFKYGIGRFIKASVVFSVPKLTVPI